MERHEIEKLYSELPDSCRERWDLERFVELSTQRVDLDAEFRVEDDGEEHGLPRAPEANEFGGLASAFGVKIDTWMPTYIERGAFKKTLGNKAERNRVKVLFQHGMPIGKPTFMKEVREGLLVMGKVSETSLGEDVLKLMRDGVVTEMSIGFDPVEYCYREDKSTKEMCRHITEVRLWEFSPVGFGANKGAKITVVNSLGGGHQGIDADVLAEAVAKKLSLHTQRFDEKDPEAVRAEIERLQGLLPAEVLEGASAEQRELLKQLGKELAA